MNTPTSIETVSGIFFDVANPRIEDVNIHDIAWGLSRQARFAGHTITDLPYSVAQHSVYVSYLVEKALTKGHALNLVLREWTSLDLRLMEDPERACKWATFGALLHDASEAYLVDLPSPVKRMPGIHEAYKSAEDRLMNVIFEACEVPYHGRWPETVKEINAVIHWADLFARAVEAYHFMPSRGREWEGMPVTSIDQLHSFRQPIPSLMAYREFMDRYNALKPCGPSYGD